MTFRVRGREFASGTHVMGIVNVTTDSFFAASRAAADEAAERAVKMVADGAAIIDIGAQSTRPGAREIGALEEMSLLLPSLERVREATDAPISVDTFYPEVAEAALAAGADMINDVSCLRFSGLAEVTARYGAAICIMHNRRGSTVPDLTADKLTGLTAAAAKAVRAGVREDGILLDGGIGFNRSAEEDRFLADHYDLLLATGYPLLMGASRKSFLGGTPETRLTATLECTTAAARMGVLFVRVHDVKENVLAIRSALTR